MKTLIICSECSKRTHEPLAVAVGDTCYACLSRLLPNLGLFLNPWSAFNARGVPCQLERPCRFIKILFQHREAHGEDPRHEVFLVKITS